MSGYTEEEWEHAMEGISHKRKKQSTNLYPKKKQPKKLKRKRGLKKGEWKG